MGPEGPDWFPFVFDGAQDRSGCVRDGASEDRVVGDLVVADQREELVGQAGEQLGELVAGLCWVRVSVHGVDLSRGHFIGVQ